MTPLQPSSDKPRGLFVTIDGPSGIGKSTVVKHLSQLLTANGLRVHTTAEPSGGPIGTLARALTETVAREALACLYSADRYHHLEQEIRPRLKAGDIVVSDRYVPSGLVMQRFDRVDPSFLWDLNAHADYPDVAVILEADPHTIATRLHARGAHNRFHRAQDSSATETRFYRHACERLVDAGYNLVRVDCADRTPDQVACHIRVELKRYSVE